jgi:hypothetical protein
MVAVGYQAGYSNTSNGASVYIGGQAGYAATGAYNVFAGYQAGVNVTTGGNNLIMGQYVSGVGGAGSQMTTGSRNTLVGAFNGNQNGYDIRTATQRVAVSDGDGWPAIHNMVSTYGGTSMPGNIDVTTNASTGVHTNAIALTTGVSTAICTGTFSGVFIINDYNQTGAVSMWITGGGTLTLVDTPQPSAWVANSSSPGASQFGVYISGNVVYIIPGSAITTAYIRTITFKTRVQQ